MARRLEPLDRVQIRSPKDRQPLPGSTGSYFEGQTGYVLEGPDDGYYRVKLDQPVRIPLHAGPDMVVTDDIWQREYLRKLRD